MLDCLNSVISQNVQDCLWKYSYHKIHSFSILNDKNTHFFYINKKFMIQNSILEVLESSSAITFGFIFSISPPAIKCTMGLYAKSNELITISYGSSF